VSDSADRSPQLSRRTLLKAGIAGAAALVAARWLYMQMSTTTGQQVAALDASSRAVVAAIVPVMLEGALPGGEAAPAARERVVAGVDLAIAGLPPAVRSEIDELFSLLAFAPTRCLIVGVWSPWPQASRDAIAGFLDRWRDSRFALLRSAFDALHRLILAAWYGNPESWMEIGYPGPPSLETAL
jgi:hypothetical protein